VTRNAFDWRLQRDDDPTAGLYYYADGEPFKDSGKLSTVDLEVLVTCNASTSLSFTGTVEHGASGPIVMFQGAGAEGCPSPTARPTATPFETVPDCVYMHRFTWFFTYGVFIDFAALNDAPFGIRRSMNPSAGFQ
jgi:hypothetical protein